MYARIFTISKSDRRVLMFYHEAHSKKSGFHFGHFNTQNQGSL